jgi:hypothetical protein
MKALTFCHRKRWLFAAPGALTPLFFSFFNAAYLLSAFPFLIFLSRLSSSPQSSSMLNSSSPTLPTEIITLIALSLGQSDLATCTRLNKYWHDCCNPLLWKVVQIFRAKDAACLDSPEGLLGLIRNAHHTHTFATCHASVAKSFATRAFPPCTSLKSLRYEIRGKQSIQFRLEAQREAIDPLGYSQVLCRLLDQNPGLRSLTVGGEWFLNSWDQEDIEKVLNCIPTAELERLEVAFDSPSNHMIPIFRSAAQDSADQDTNPFVALKELVFTDHRGGQLGDPGFEKGLIKRCVNLESIRLDHSRIIFQGDLMQAISRWCPRLTRLYYHSDREDTDMNIMSMLTMSRAGWKAVQLCGLMDIGPLSIRQLVADSRTLEVIKLDSWCASESAALFTLLSTAARLCRLEGVQDGSEMTYINELLLNAYDATLVANHPWVLGESMRYFQMRIENVPRPDVVCDRNGAPLDNEPDALDAAAMTRRYEVQRFIYTQLSRMTGLRELHLGVPDTASAPHSWIIDARDIGLLDDPGHNIVRDFNYSSLEFSLASGLDLLAGMKELRVLDVRWTTHRIGVEELEWMHVNWPQLREIRGLDSAREWAGDAEAGLAVKAKVGEWVAAHPRGIGSSLYS